MNYPHLPESGMRVINAIIILKGGDGGCQDFPNLEVAAFHSEITVSDNLTPPISLMKLSEFRYLSQNPNP